MDKRVDTTDCINFLAMAVGFVKLDNKWHSDELTTGRRHWELCGLKRSVCDPDMSNFWTRNQMPHAQLYPMSTGSRYALQSDDGWCKERDANNGQAVQLNMARNYNKIQ